MGSLFGSRSGGTMTSTTKNLPTYAQSYVVSYTDRATTLSTSEFLNPFSGATYADPDANEEAGTTGLYNRGINGDILDTKAKAYVDKLLNGDYLDGAENDFNTTLKADVLVKSSSKYTTSIEPLLMESAYSSGEITPPYDAKNTFADITKLTSRTEAFLHMDNYVTEKVLQRDGVAKAPIHADREYIDGEAARLAGVYKRNWYHGKLEDEYSRYIHEDFLSIKRLEILGEAIKTLVSSGSTTSKPTFKPPLANSIVGGALAGAALGAKIGSVGGAPGAAIGAGIGLIFG